DATKATSREPVQSPHLATARRKDLDVLRAAWRDAQRGAARVVVVRGAGGTGKTRLARELRAEVQRDGGLGLEVAGAAAGSASWAAATALVEQLAALRVPVGAATQTELARLCPALWPDAPPAVPLDSDAARSRLQEALLTLLAEAARELAVLLVIDDAQWLDEASRQLFAALARPIGLLRTLFGVA